MFVFPRGSYHIDVLRRKSGIFQRHQRNWSKELMGVGRLSLADHAVGVATIRICAAKFARNTDIWPT